MIDRQYDTNPGIFNVFIGVSPDFDYPAFLLICSYPVLLLFPSFTSFHIYVQTLQNRGCFILPTAFYAKLIYGKIPNGFF